MQRLNYPLKKYQKAVEKIAEEKGLSHIRVVPNKGSAVRFELFEHKKDIPLNVWIIHHIHNKKKDIVSKEDYRKAALCLCCSVEEFIKRVASS